MLVLYTVLLTFDPQWQFIANRFTFGINSTASIITSRMFGHFLQYQTLIRTYYSRSCIVCQMDTLKGEIIITFLFTLIQFLLEVSVELPEPSSYLYFCFPKSSFYKILIKYYKNNVKCLHYAAISISATVDSPAHDTQSTHHPLP